jgi:hypothetical protein
MLGRSHILGRILRRDRGRKLLCLFLLGFQAVFLNIIVPGHTRGIITLSGKNAVAGAADLGCPFCTPIKSDTKKTPNRQDRDECAICNLAIRLAPWAPIDFGLDRLGLLMLEPAPEAQEPVFVAVACVHYSRGPPAC